MYPHILLAADGSENSIRAAKEALKIAKCGDKTKVTILFVIDVEKVKTEVLHAQSIDSLYMERRQKLVPIEQLFESENLNFNVQMTHGTPGPEIIKFANTQNVDLVIIGSRGLNGLQEMVLGSVSHKVMKRVNCPAMLVK
ncbi:universal stress protein [Lysinibacillus sp. 2017]|uniref:universal stress protein n=1 Tax=unclassified Lysinibacillus TaxID=2636778 RepID=UPI000D528D90|nr:MULTISPECIES: universal stress protein [unclassified Lysinibacillus]AWE07562.1 universal stress protein [Lysinibacillus sp. 2017]TGN36725.1 universal stress protein [Lysinibacillus sp. S2017]